MNIINYVSKENLIYLLSIIIPTFNKHTYKIDSLENDINELKYGRPIDGGYLTNSTPSENTFDGGEL